MTHAESSRVRLRAAFSMRCTRRRWLLAVISASLCTSAAYADEDSARINYFERLEGLRIVDAVPVSSAEPRHQTNTTLIFDAFGRRFTLVLERNEQLTSKLPLETKRRIADIELYRGTVDGLPESWVRLTRQGGTVSGVVWDGTDLYAIERVEHVASRFVTPSEFSAGTTIIYRSRDTVDGAGKPVVVAPRGFQKTSEQIEARAGVRSTFKQVDVGLVADTLLVAARPDATRLMLQTMNIADGFFLQQLGMHLNVTQIMEAPQPDPFTSNDPATLRTALEAYKSGSEALRNLGLVHLFTGRALTGDSGEKLNVIGIANVGSLCDPVRAVSLHQASANGVFPEKVVAHEIAHVFGAPHDGQVGSACSATPTTYLMAPVYNGSEQLSECSIEQMRAKIASVSCTADVPPNDVSVRPTYVSDSLLAGRSFSGNVTIERTGPTDAFGLELKIAGNGVEITEAGNFGPCTKSAGAFYCTVNRLGAAVPADAYFRGVAPMPGHASVEVSVTSSSDPNPANNSYRFELDFLPAINFSTSRMAASPVGVHPGEVSEITWDFVNTGPSPATNVELTISSEWFDIVTFAPPGGGTCRPHPAAMPRWICAIGTVPVNQPQRLLLQARALSSKVPPRPQLTNGLTFAAAATEPQLNLNTFVSAPVVIASTIGDVVVEMTGLPAVAVEGSPVEVTLIGRNAGPDTAHGVVLFLRDDARALTVINATSTAGTCAAGRFETVECTLDTLASGDSVAITIQGVTRTFRDASYRVAAIIRSDDFDPSTANNVASTDMRVTVREPPPPPTPPPSSSGVDSGGGTSGGGGGKIDLLWLAALITLLLSRRRSPTIRPLCCPLWSTE